MRIKSVAIATLPVGVRQLGIKRYVVAVQFDSV